MKGSRIGLLGQTISIIHHSVDLLFFRVQCKQAPSCEVFTGEPLEASLVAQLFACHARDHLWCRRSRFHPWFGKIPWSRKWQPTPVFLPGESHGQRSWQETVRGVAKSQTQLSGQAPKTSLSTYKMVVGYLNILIQVPKYTDSLPERSEDVAASRSLSISALIAKSFSI